MMTSTFFAMYESSSMLLFSVTDLMFLKLTPESKRTIGKLSISSGITRFSGASLFI